jgi:hypothetical protein
MKNYLWFDFAMAGSTFNHLIVLFPLLAGFVISLFFMVAQMILNPYCTKALNITQSTALLANTLTLFIGLMLIIDASMQAEALLAGDKNYDTTGRSVISIIIVIVNLAVLVIPTTISVLQSGYVYKVSSFLSGKNKNDAGNEDPESSGNDNDPEMIVDDLSQPVDLPIPALAAEFPSHTELILPTKEHAASCSIPENLRTLNLVQPVLKFASSEEVQSHKADIVQEPHYSDPIIKKFNSLHLNRVSTQLAGSENMQSMIYSEEASDPHHNVDLGHDGANDFLHAKMKLQQTTNEVVCLVAEGLAEMQELPASSGNHV